MLARAALARYINSNKLKSSFFDKTDIRLVNFSIVAQD